MVVCRIGRNYHYWFVYFTLFLDQDPEDYFLNRTLNMSGMAVSDDSDEEEELRTVDRESRKHIIYQSAILELYEQVITFCQCYKHLKSEYWAVAPGIYFGSVFYRVQCLISYDGKKRSAPGLAQCPSMHAPVSLYDKHFSR